MFCKKSRKSGFTFVEMLMSTAMSVVLAIVLYVMLSNGIKVWQLVTRDSPQIDVNLFFERITEELQNGFAFSDQALTGGETEFTFSTVLKSGPGWEDYFESVAGRVSYSYDEQEKTLHRKEVDYQRLFSKHKPIARQLLEEVQSFSLQYYFYDQEKETFFWSSIWPPLELESMQTVFPLAVKIKLAFVDNKTIEQRIKTINIPAGGILN
ncbi:MAG: hypothetical protein GY853_09270 [PVC group bacterium]|nr:hypothetical protein [PVC group bacterium]